MELYMTDESPEAQERLAMQAEMVQLIRLLNAVGRDGDVIFIGDMRRVFAVVEEGRRDAFLNNLRIVLVERLDNLGDVGNERIENILRQIQQRDPVNVLEAAQAAQHQARNNQPPQHQEMVVPRGDFVMVGAPLNHLPPLNMGPDAINLNVGQDRWQLFVGEAHARVLEWQERILACIGGGRADDVAER